MNSKTLLITFILLCASTTPVYAMELESDKVLNEAAQFKDAYLNRKSSIHYIAALQARFDRQKSGISEMPKKLLQMIEHRDHESLILFLGEGRLQPLNQGTKSQSLHQAANIGYTSFCEFLLEARIVDANCLSDMLDTPLHKATRGRPVETCKVLLGHGGDVRARNRAERMPLDNVLLHCNAKGARELSSLLLKHGAPASVLRRIRADGVLNPLCSIVLSYNRHVAFCAALPELLRFGMNPQEQDLQENTLLHYVADAVTYSMELMDAQSLVPRKGQIATQIVHTLVLEAQKAQTIKRVLMVLAMHKFRKDSLIAVLPKDVVRYVLVPLIMPSMTDCVDEQLKILGSLLSIPNNEKQTPYERLPADARKTKMYAGDANRYEPNFFVSRKRIIQICDLFDPTKAELQRKALTLLTSNTIQGQK